MNPTTGVIAVERSGFRAVRWPIREPGRGVRKPWRAANTTVAATGAGVVVGLRGTFLALVRPPNASDQWGLDTTDVRERSLALSGALTTAITAQPSSGQGETTSESGKDQRYSSDFATTRVLAEQ